ncbi:MAG: sugar phosphate isomerase/epimerase family protein [Armatimonadota bacterium]|nr:sugar phosphate isomerase/epimerase family protein [Armatimonadota bacterium]MDR7427009.1 sugar phosphate isomerase/epimerase family protein [Armatimonadota bacterium]MDR7463073.1 sugar phosphate isomerase/epimerase family protein [Armatimonadota bacterium]MDR7469344.1 sugar phosphate isomerase/epimerase family protein [Armatimonadota bacterium]MDR7475597.1 sugar phosphate isomerase/epimerase family protein [Armatimonadota bacterium]
MRPALSTTSLRSFAIRDVVEAAHRMDYAGVEIWAEHLWARGEDPATLARQAATYGLTVSVHGPSRDLNVTSTNPGIREESQRQYYRALDDAARLGASVIVFHPGALSSSRDRPEDYWPRLTAFFAALGQVAGKRGITLTVENMEERPGEFVTHPGDVVRLVDAAGTSALGLALDIAHLLFNRKPVDLTGLERYIRHVHLSGSTDTLAHVPLADGLYDLRPPLRQLARFYTGIIAIEGYVAEREMRSVEENRRVFDRLIRFVAATSFPDP